MSFLSYESTRPWGRSINDKVVKREMPPWAARSGPQHEDGHRLIGLSEFDLPAHKGHTVLVKGLFIKAAPVSRVNVTSVAMVSTACAPAAK